MVCRVQIRTASDFTMVRDRVRLGPAGVFLDDQRVADIDAVLQSVARASVVEVRTKPGFPTGLIVGGALAAWGFYALAVEDDSQPPPELDYYGASNTVIGVSLIASGAVVAAISAERRFRSPVVYSRRP